MSRIPASDADERHGPASDATQAADDSFDALLRHAAQASEPLQRDPRSRLPLGASLAGGRLSVLRRIGEGGMGVVYEAFDSERRARVALKTLSHLDPASVYRLKNEFRSLTDVRHPSLVQLHELFADGPHWFFTMELIVGERFDYWVRPARPAPDASAPDVIELDEARLRVALPQLLAAIDAIHAAGKLHRDIKPNNVLVTEDGRVVVLDFGLVVDPDLGGVGQTVTDQSVSGTPAYMAPEQAAGHVASQASDLYALGVMLFEALTGRLPFTGSIGEMLAVKQTQDAPSAYTLAPDAPADLADVCAQLLARDATLRPVAATLRSSLLAADGGGDATPHAPTYTRAEHVPQLFGRERELAALRDAYQATLAGQAVVLLVSGDSGMGKSALLESFSQTLRAEGQAVVLAGRCHERENVPYKGLDALVDDLSRQLRRMPASDAAALLPREVYALARLFPVLDRVPVIAGAPKKELSDLHLLQQRAFSAFVELMARLRDRQPLVLLIDDLQWTDQDSVRFMRQLWLQREPVPALVVLAHRAENASDNALLQSIIEAASANRSLSLRALRIAALDHAALVQLALSRLAGRADAKLAQGIASEAQGSPFFAGELARAALTHQHVAPTLNDALAAHVQALPPDAQRVLSVLALAGQPLAPVAAIQAAGLRDGHEQLDLLRSEHLLRMSIDSEGTRAIECYHDKVREVVTSRMDATLARALFAGLSHALLASSNPDPELLTRCLEAAGFRVQAAEHAVQAAERAMQALAFDRAARLYEKAVELSAFAGARLHALHVARADALARAGRGVVAGDAYLAARASATPEQALSLTRQAAEQYLMCGRMVRGRALLAEGLRPLGIDMPMQLAAAVAAGVWSRLRFRLRGLRFVARTDQDAATLARLEALRIATNGLLRSDTVRCIDFVTRWTLLALDSGHTVELARALSVQLAVGAIIQDGRLPLMEQLADALCDQTGDVLARTTFHYGRAWCRFGFDMPWCGDLSGSIADSERSLALLHERPHADAAYDEPWYQWIRASAMLMAGRFVEVRDVVQTHFALALAKSDLTMVPQWAVLAAVVMPALGQIDQARLIVKQAHAAWQSDEVALQDSQVLTAIVALSVYDRDARGGWRDCQPLLQRMQKSILPRMLLGRISDGLCAGLVAAAAIEASDHEEHRALSDQAMRLGKRAARGSGAASASARIVMACVAGDRTQAVNRLREFLRLPALNPNFVQVGRYHLGRLLDDEEGRSLVQQSDTWLRSRGVVDPERFSVMLMPGIELR